MREGEEEQTPHLKVVTEGEMEMGLFSSTLSSVSPLYEVGGLW